MKMAEAQRIVTWINLGVVCGLLASVAYPAIIIFDMPVSWAVAVAATFGVSLAAASIGLYHFVALHRNTATLQLAAILNVIAGALFTAMLVVQIGIGEFMEQQASLVGTEISQPTYRLIFGAVDKVQLGLDMVFDIFIGVGTLLFAFNMASHPRFNVLFAAAGGFIACALLVLNASTFPVPPGDAGLVDLGPFVGAWYLLSTLVILISARWIRNTVKERFEPAGTSAVQAG